LVLWHNLQERKSSKVSRRRIDLYSRDRFRATRKNQEEGQWLDLPENPTPDRIFDIMWYMLK
jgi:hypothetical protein